MLAGLPAGLRVVQRSRLGGLHLQRLLRSGARPQASRPSASGPSPAACCRFRSALARPPCCSPSASPRPRFLPPLFWAALGAYLVMTTAYSLSVKRMLLLDVLTLAGLYTMRILAGAAATGIDVSFWLLAFCDLLLPVAGAGEALRRTAAIGAGRRRTHRRARLSRRGPGDHCPGRHGVGLFVGAGAGALHRQRRGQGTLQQSLDGVAAGADRPLPHHARLDPGAPRRDA